MLAGTLQLQISEELCRNISLVPPSPSSPAFQLSSLLAQQNKSLDVIIGDGNCYFRAVSKELFGDERHHTQYDAS